MTKTSFNGYPSDSLSGELAMLIPLLVEELSESMSEKEIDVVRFFRLDNALSGDMSS